MLETNLKGPLTVALIVLGVSLGLGIAGVLIMSHYLNNEARAISMKRSTTVQAASLTPRISELRAQQTQAASYERIFSLLLPKQDQLLEVPRVIEQSGKAYNVDAKFQFQSSPALDVTSATALPFALQATGRSDDLAAYLRHLEVTNPRYMISVGRAEITASPQNPERSTLAIQGNLYYQP